MLNLSNVKGTRPELRTLQNAAVWDIGMFNQANKNQIRIGMGCLTKVYSFPILFRCWPLQYNQQIYYILLKY